MSTPPCPICQKHRGHGPLVGPVIYADELLHVSHRAPGSSERGALGHVFVETRRRVPSLDRLTDTEAVAGHPAAGRG